MSRRVNLIGICAVSSLCILLLIANQHRPPIPEPAGYSTELFNQSVTIGDILAQQRASIAKEMENFDYPCGRFGVDAEKLSDLTPETGGKPVRSVIITTWRSGSTFLGDILNAMPGNYYHYEPLLNFDIMQVRGPPEDKVAISNLKHLLNCEYRPLHDYLNYGKDHVYLFQHNVRLWNQCTAYPQYCWRPKFLGPFCRLFPMQSMKVVRLRLALAEELLTDERSSHLISCLFATMCLATDDLISSMGLRFSMRFNEHIKEAEECIEKRRPMEEIKSSVAKQIVANKHEIRWEDLEVVQEENRVSKLDAYESLWILRQPENLRLNEDVGNGYSKLLKIISLNVRIILLVRDPRGTMQSRKHRQWCPGNPDCDDPARLCADLESDYYAAEQFSKKYSSRFKALRYEDLSLSPYDLAQEVLQFFGLPFDSMVEEFLDTHTKVDIGGVSSTFRDSKSTPFHWIRDLMWDEMESIQNVCTKAMELWGYRKANDTRDLAYFEPLLQAPFT